MRKVSRAAALLLAPLAAVTLLSVSATAAEQPMFTPTVIVVDGAYNVRDIGGYPVSGGRTILHGVVYRSGELNAVTPTGVTELAKLNLADVVDLRTAQEISASGADIVPSGVTVVNEPESLPAPTTEAIAISDYQQMVDSAAIRAATAATLRTIIADRGAPVLINCTGGADRTGWTIAVLEEILGMSADNVMSDYLYSNTALGVTIVQSQYLQAALDETVHTFGSFTNYVHNGLGLSSTEIAELNNLLT